jgi:hypothetical protein
VGEVWRGRGSARALTLETPSLSSARKGIPAGVFRISDGMEEDKGKVPEGEADFIKMKPPLFVQSRAVAESKQKV